MIKLDVISDPICPWCYIGKTHLDRALADHPDHPFTIEWHPFQLNPDMRPEGMDRRDYVETKFGGPENAARVYGRIAEAARAAGLDLDFSKITRTPNTVNAHRLIHWAGLEGRQTPVVMGLFRAYFEEGRDIGDTEVLVSVATAAGLDGDMVRTLLAGEADAEDIRARDAHARNRGVNGVPTFVLAQQHVLTGAQPPEVWGQVIEQVRAHLQGTAEAGPGEQAAQ